MTETRVEVRRRTGAWFEATGSSPDGRPLNSTELYETVIRQAMEEVCPDTECRRANRYAFGLAQDFFAEEIHRDETYARAKRLFGRLCNLDVCVEEPTE